MCGENDGRIGVCIPAKVDCTVFTVFTVLSALLGTDILCLSLCSRAAEEE